MESLEVVEDRLAQRCLLGNYRSSLDDEAATSGSIRNSLSA